MEKIGVISMGIKAPIVREGDDLADIVVKSVLQATWNGHTNKYDLNDKDVLGITESIVARNQGNYVTLDEISEEIKTKFNNPETIVVINPIYSRNRFSMILKAIARAAEKRIVIVMPDFDEVGNPRGENPWTGVDMENYYMDICSNEGKNVVVYRSIEDTYFFNGDSWLNTNSNIGFLYCGLHDYNEWKWTNATLCLNKYYLTLADICANKSKYGLLGSNKATEEKLKLFPHDAKAQNLVEDIQKRILKETGKKIEVCVFGDGCFHSPSNGKPGSSIWEFADPVVSPAYTKGLEGSPNEIKIKAFADDKYKNLNGKELEDAIKGEIKEKEKSLVGNMASQGTTPRKYTDLLGSLMDLTSGSGDKGTPFVLVKNYFNNYSN